MPDQSLFDIHPTRQLLALGADWGLITAALVLAVLLPHPLIYITSAVVIARTQLALAVMMHEGAHGLLSREQRVNEVLGQALAAGPLFLSLASYRAGHLKHHLAPMTYDDPVAVVFGINDYPVSRRVLVRRLLSDLTGIAYFTSVVRMAQGRYRAILPKLKKSRALMAFEGLSMVIPNALLLGVLSTVGETKLYFALWLLPAVTLLPFMGRIRAIMEHAGLPESSDQSLNARTIVRPSWQTFLFGPHGIHYHIEHHLYPKIPFYHLAAVHRQLSERRLLPSSNLYRGYGAVLRDVSYKSRKA